MEDATQETIGDIERSLPIPPATTSIREIFQQFSRPEERHREKGEKPQESKRKSKY